MAILGGAFLFAFACSAVDYILKIKKSGRCTKGVVTGTDDTLWGIKPVFSFTDHTGRNIEGMAQNVKRGRYTFVLTPGTAVTIYYWPQKPEVFVVYRVPDQIIFYIGMSVGVMLCLGGIVSLITGQSI